MYTQSTGPKCHLRQGESPYQFAVSLVDESCSWFLYHSLHWFSQMNYIQSPIQAQTFPMLLAFAEKANASKVTRKVVGGRNIERFIGGREGPVAIGWQRAATATHGQQEASLWHP